MCATGEHGPKGQAQNALPTSLSCLHPQPQAQREDHRWPGSGGAGAQPGESKSSPQDPHILRLHKIGGNSETQHR